MSDHPAGMSNGAVLAIGAGAGFLTFGAMFAIFMARNKDQIQQDTSPAGATIAEEAVKSYLATRVGLTTEKLQQISQLVHRIQNLGG